MSGSGVACHPTAEDRCATTDRQDAIPSRTEGRLVGRIPRCRTAWGRTHGPTVPPSSVRRATEVPPAASVRITGWSSGRHEESDVQRVAGHTAASRSTPARGRVPRGLGQM